jgi:hypothetical protein
MHFKHNFAVFPRFFLILFFLSRPLSSPFSVCQPVASPARSLLKSVSVSGGELGDVLLVAAAT